MIRNDGEYTIYIIQHKYKDPKDENWYNSGSCDAFIKVETRKQWDKIVYNEPFRSIHASGDCWQETGIQGTYDFDKAQQVMIQVAQWNPGREFRVAQLNIKQETTQLSTIMF